MEQLNNPLPLTEEKQPAAEELFRYPESPLLLQMRHKYGLYGGISLTFGVGFALFFYRAWIGLNVFFYSAIIVALLTIVMTKLTPKMKVGTKLYFGAVLLLGASTALTSNETLLFLNIVAMLILLDLSLLHQFYEVGRWEFIKHLGKMINLVFISIACLWMPFADGLQYFKKIKVLKNDKVRNIIIGTLISIPILFVITLLLSSADMLFGSVAEDIYDGIFSADIFWIISMVVFGMLACYCILSATLLRVGMEEKKGFAKADASIAATVITLLCLLYACFCVLQILYLFTGGLLVLPEGYTYAEYARRGFFELMFVTAINISLMILCRTLFKESKFLNFLVVFMTACTFILIASATYRMLLYINSYHLTFLRLFVLLVLFIEVFILTGVIISEFRKNFPLFTYSVAVITICYLVFALGKPDYVIASYLIHQKDTLNMEDLSYLSTELSLDAAPVLLPILENEKRWDKNAETSGDYGFESDRIYPMSYEDMVKNYYQRIEEANDSIDIREFNYSTYIAGKTAKEYPVKKN